MGFSSQEYWSGLPFPPPRDLPDPGIEPVSLMSPALAGRFFTTAPPGKPQVYIKQLTNRIQCENREESQGKLGVKSSSSGGLGEEIQGQAFLGTYWPLHFFWPSSIFHSVLLPCPQPSKWSHRIPHCSSKASFQQSLTLLIYAILHALLFLLLFFNFLFYI